MPHLSSIRAKYVLQCAIYPVSGNIYMNVATDIAHGPGLKKTEGIL